MSFLYLQSFAKSSLAPRHPLLHTLCPQQHAQALGVHLSNPLRPTTSRSPLPPKTYPHPTSTALPTSPPIHTAVILLNPRASPRPPPPASPPAAVILSEGPNRPPPPRHPSYRCHPCLVQPPLQRCHPERSAQREVEGPRDRLATPPPPTPFHHDHSPHPPPQSKPRTALLRPVTPPTPSS